MITLLAAFLLLYPAALLGGIIQGNFGARYASMRWPIIGACWVALMLIVLPLVS